MNGRTDRSTDRSHEPARADACDETRATRLHYRLRCLLPRHHSGDHQWTPELVPSASGDEAATG